MSRIYAAVFFAAATIGESGPQAKLARTALLAEHKQPADFGLPEYGDATDISVARDAAHGMLKQGDRGRTERRHEQTAALHEALGTTPEDDGPRIEGDRNVWLNNHEVSGIMTIECLELRQKDPRDPCVSGGPAATPSSTPAPTEEQPGPLNMGNYPSWRDPECHSNGALFCDPEGLLQGNLTIAKSITDLLLDFKAMSSVTCGEVEAQVAGDPQLKHTRKFNLGVALADEWPESEMDAGSLEKFGNLLMTQWGMLPFYNGVDTMNGLNQPGSPSQADTNCPNAAVLIILPRHHEVYLASPGCQFICQERGGQMINTAMLDALETGGLAFAIETGVKEVSQMLHMMTPQTMENFGYRTYFRREPSIRERWLKSENDWIFMIRLVFLSVLAVFLYLFWWAFTSWGGEPLRTNLERSAAAAAEKAGRPR